MPWVGQTAIKIAEAVRNGEVTVGAVVEEHLDTIEARDTTIGAFRKVRAEEAIREAKAVEERDDLAELPLAGVPIAIKDNVAVKGEETRNGSVATPEEPATEDHPVVARLRRAGAVVVGITNVPELCLVAFCDSAYGIAHNPWDLARTPGGSSGGSAAAVAAGMVPLAHGNDGLGSLRIPGACCGLVAVKPGVGVIPAPKHDWFSMSENGPIATTVADAALALAIMADDMSFAQALPRSPISATPPTGGMGADESAWTASPPELRIAIAPNPLPVGFTMDKEFQHAVEEVGATLRGAGHTVVEHGRRMPVSLGLSAIMTWFSCAADDTRELDHRRLEKRTRALARAGRAVDTLRLDGATGRKRWRESGADRWFGDADVLITPTLAHLPPPAERWGDRGLIRNVMINLTYAPVTAAWNLAGWPALTIPFGRHSGGMPIGVQLIAPPGDEARLLGLAAQLETARPWIRHAPAH